MSGLPPLKKVGLPMSLTTKPLQNTACATSRSSPGAVVDGADDNALRGIKADVGTIHSLAIAVGDAAVRVAFDFEATTADNKEV